jgi:hypothetical protein
MEAADIIPQILTPPPLSFQFDFNPADVDSAFSVRPLPDIPTAQIKVKFSVPHKPQAVFRPLHFLTGMFEFHLP